VTVDFAHQHPNSGRDPEMGVSILIPPCPNQAAASGPRQLRTRRHRRQNVGCSASEAAPNRSNRLQRRTLRATCPPVRISVNESTCPIEIIRVVEARSRRFQLQHPLRHSDNRDLPTAALVAHPGYRHASPPEQRPPHARGKAGALQGGRLEPFWILRARPRFASCRAACAPLRLGPAGAEVSMEAP
jgi:hypothetical protein